MGSYLLELRKEGHDVVRYPISIERSQHWDGLRPGAYEPHPIVLPRQGSLAAHECYVPAGWFWAGGDPNAYDSLPRQRYWADAFVMQQFPVTNREYIMFLDDLVRQGYDSEALDHVPRERAAAVGTRGAMIYRRNAQGCFELQPDADGDVWLNEEPVSMIDWYAAQAYAAWRTHQDNRPWRLAMELEWVKAARGVDGRFFPWGDGFDPSWCCMRSSHQGARNHALIESYPIDVSVYGIRGLGGNSRDWCQDISGVEAPTSVLVHTPTSPQTDNPQRPVGVRTGERRFRSGARRAVRGGAWNYSEINCRSGTRNANIPSDRLASVGIRLVRTYHHGT